LLKASPWFLHFLASGLAELLLQINSLFDIFNSQFYKKVFVMAHWCVNVWWETLKLNASETVYTVGHTIKCHQTFTAHRVAGLRKTFLKPNPVGLIGFGGFIGFWLSCFFLLMSRFCKKTPLDSFWDFYEFSVIRMNTAG